ncbi:hypothetical protein EW146_g9909 [Bondarzewia mesenterica]|uniref:Amidohydrolase-related domain-containing protein n=1 Tax=Bondarzewia mesenterica TaxID=1095465 RepID=A0A4S4L3K8_9AGAM|nr:hypothetical protein EW146_g9909 [Bondarzewia mesenterica]
MGIKCSGPWVGPYLHYLEVARLSECSSEIAKDNNTFGNSCIRDKKIVQWQEVHVSYSTDIQRLKEQARKSKPQAINADVFFITNATILTMEGGRTGQTPIRGGSLITRGGVIEAVDYTHNLVIPQYATVIDAQGGKSICFVLKELVIYSIDPGFGELYPATSWEHQAFLAYGITTLHNPSADTVTTFTQRSRVESGQLLGPRIFQTGTIIYGAGEGEYHQDIVDDAEAHSALLRIKVEGGPASFSYKNYNLPSRAARQRLLKAAQDLSMLCVPEGGMNFDWDLTYIIDGMTTVEHAIPVPTLYDDVLTLWAKSGTGSTPTHIVNYGGAWGEQFVWANEDVPNNPKKSLNRRHAHSIVSPPRGVFIVYYFAKTRPHIFFSHAYALFNTSASTAEMVHRGLRAHIGAHGENPIGLNYHAEMWFAKQGGLSNYEVIRAATSDAADTLGILGSLGSLAPGKLADYVVYPPGFDVLEDDIRGTQVIWYVARGGRLWDAETMREEWPVKGKTQVLPRLNED